MLLAADQALLDDVLAGSGEAQRRAIAKAITLLESTRADHRERADALLTALPQPPARVSHRHLRRAGRRQVDLHRDARPAPHRARACASRCWRSTRRSSVSGGSILGDKTRMERLSVARARVRAAEPERRHARRRRDGAPARRSRVVEAAGYDVVIVETVGVGQSEAAVAGMTDMFVLLQLPNAGDDLQAIKKGVMELADLVVVNKADLDPAAAARARRPDRARRSQLVGRRRRRGVDAPGDGAQRAAIRAAAGRRGVWDVRRALPRRPGGERRGAERRRAQAQAWLWERIEAGLRQAFRPHPQVRARLAGRPAAVDAGGSRCRWRRAGCCAALAGNGGVAGGGRSEAARP